MILTTLIRSTYVLNQCSLVLEGITLAQVVELVVQMLVDLAAGTVLDEETAENTETAHPDDLALHLSEHVTISPTVK
jgi:prophage maintenance system killer protein